MSQSSPALCPRCGTPLDDNRVDGLCARCLGAANFATDTVVPGEGIASLPTLTPEELAPHFPQLEILECLGRGGMGVVYKARQKSLNRLVALKLLAPERADDPAFAARFEKEAHALAALNHPHIVGVHDFGQAGGFYYLLMEFVDGMNLRQLLQTKRLTPKEALSIVPPICEALQCAHDAGIVHRDIKPENLLIDKNGTVKIADFGIAKIVARYSATESAPPADSVAENQATFPLGTPDYAAPEQASGTADHRADIYSLGVVLYEMLTGERPTAKLEAPSKRVQVDIRIDEIVLRALEKSPELRFATAAEFRTQVEAVTTMSEKSNVTAAGQERTTQGYLALICGGMSALIPTIFYWLAPWALPWLSPVAQVFMLILTLIFAVLAIALGMASRNTQRGRRGLIIGSISLTIWLLFFIAGQLSINLIPSNEAATKGAKNLRGRILDRNGAVLAESTPENVRRYPLSTHMAHTVGYAGWSGGKASILEGRAGIEKQQNGTLRRGKDVRLTLDSRVQTLTARALRDGGAVSGAAVVLDPRTGELLALVSLPTYDPNQFVPTISHEAWSTYYDDGASPLLQRSIEDFTPGSCFTPMIGLAGIAAGIGGTQFNCEGSVTYGSQVLRCWISQDSGGRHGKLGLTEALAYSCPCFWYQFGNTAGVGKIESMGRKIGFGTRYGIAEFENDGVLPTESWLSEEHPDMKCSDLLVANMSVGQGYVTATPLQLAVLAATLANGGRVPQPRLLHDSAKAAWRADLVAEGLPTTEIEKLRHAMHSVVNADDGTAALAKSNQVVIAGKDSTAQYWRRGEDGKQEKYNHAWFIGFAPYDQPTLAFAILVQGGESGGSTCAPIAKRIVEEALALPNIDSNVMPLGQIERSGPVESEPTDGQRVPSPPPAPKVDIIQLEATADEIFEASAATPERPLFKAHELSQAAIKRDRPVLTALLNQQETKNLLAGLKDKARFLEALPEGLLSNIAIRDVVDGSIHLGFDFKGVPGGVTLPKHYEAVLITVPDASSPTQVRYYLLSRAEKLPGKPSTSKHTPSTQADSKLVFGPERPHVLACEVDGIAPHFQFAGGKTFAIRSATAASPEEIKSDWDKAAAAGSVDFSLSHEGDDILIHPHGCAFGEWVTDDLPLLFGNRTRALVDELTATNDVIRLGRGQWPVFCLFRTSRGVSGLLKIESVEQADGKPMSVTFVYQLEYRLTKTPQTQIEFYYKTTTLWREGDFEGVVRVCDEAVVQHPGVAGFFLNRASAHAALQQYDKALTDFAQALRLDPGNEIIHRTRSVAYFEMGDYDRAIADLDIAVKASPEGVNFDLCGRAYHAKGDFRAALADYEKGAQATPGFTHSFVDLAWLLATCPDDSIRDGQKARQYADLAVGKMPGHESEVSIALAAAHAEERNYANAIQLEQAVLKALPPDGQEAAESKERLKHYQAHQPLRSSMPITRAMWR